MVGALLNVPESENMEILRIGDQAPYFCLGGTDGRIHSLSDYIGSPCLVVVFTSNHCPYARMYEERLTNLHSRFKPFGTEFVAICSNDGSSYPEDSFDKMRDKNFPYPYLHDESQIVARAFGAQATPEVFVFDSEHILRFHGAIDDNAEEPSKVVKSYLAVAIESVLNCSAVPNPEVPMIGCSIKWNY
jgi:peroxiredoxin